MDDISGQWSDSVAAGKTQNDGLTRVVINSGQGKIEYTYTDGTWNKRVFDTSVQRGDLFVARLRADGHCRVYAAHTSKGWGTPVPKEPVKQFF